MNTLYFLSGLSAFIALIAIIFAAHHQIEETKCEIKNANQKRKA